jgi:hypothetical protein
MRKFELAVIATIFLSFLITCSTANIASSGNSKALPSVTPVLQDSSLGNKPIEKESGWQVPKAEKKEEIKTRTTSAIAEDGSSVLVTITDYAIPGGFTYNESQAAGDTIVQGNLKTGNYSEFKVNGNFFLYAIFARSVRDANTANNNASHNHSFVYQIIDQDGDGKFETLLKNNKYVVPSWTLK